MIGVKNEDWTTNISVVDINVAASGEPFVWENWSPKIFPGFYDTAISGSDWVQEIIDNDSSEIQYCERHDLEIPKGYLRSWEEFEDTIESKHTKFWKAFENIVADTYTIEIWDKVKMDHKDHIIRSMAFDHLWSPKYYNFETDRLNIVMTADWENLENYIQSSLEDFRAYLKKNFTSYDGFISFTPNTYEGLKNNFRYRGICIEYLILNVLDSKDASEDAFYDSIEYNMFEHLCELSIGDVVYAAEQLEQQEKPQGGDDG